VDDDQRYLAHLADSKRTDSSLFKRCYGNRSWQSHFYLTKKITLGLGRNLADYSQKEEPPPWAVKLSLQLSDFISQSRERQNLSRFDSTMFLLVPITTMAIGLSSNWVLDQNHYLSLGLVSYLLDFVIISTIGCLIPTVATFGRAYIKDSIMLRVRAVKLLLVTNALFGFGFLFVIVADVVAFVKPYDAGFFYQMTGAGGAFFFGLVPILSPLWLYWKSVSWFRDNVPQRCESERLAQPPRDMGDRIQFLILSLRIFGGSGLIAFIIGVAFVLVFRYAISRTPFIVAAVGLSILFVSANFLNAVQTAKRKAPHIFETS
jgi:hypothetical protein